MTSRQLHRWLSLELLWRRLACHRRAPLLHVLGLAGVPVLTRPVWRRGLRSPKGGIYLSLPIPVTAKDEERDGNDHEDDTAQNTANNGAHRRTRRLTVPG